MTIKGYEQLYGEEFTWLNRARGRLVEGVLARTLSGTANQLLDVGAGPGFHIARLGKYGATDAVEVFPPAFERLRARPALRDMFTDYIPFDLDRRYDFIMSLDAVQAMDDDRAALNWMVDHLKPGGVMLLLLPAYQWMFSYHDTAVHNHRRYDRASLLAALPAGMTMVQSGYFNTTLFPLAVASRVAGTLARRFKSGRGDQEKQSGHLPPAADRLFSRILNAEADRIIAGAEPPFGLTVFCVVRKPE